MEYPKFEHKNDGWEVKVTAKMSLPGRYTSLLQAQKGLKVYLTKQEETVKLRKSKATAEKG